MNIYGLLAMVIGCITLVAVIWLMAKHPITFRIIRATELPKMDPPIPPREITKEELDNMKKEPATVIEQQKEEYISMDAVIKSANELMGIQTMTKDEEVNNGR